MDKQNILETNKSTKRIRDEREEKIDFVSNNFGMILAMMLTFAFTIYSFFKGLSAEPFIAIICMYLTGTALKRYKQLGKSKPELLVAILFGLASIINIILFVIPK